MLANVFTKAIRDRWIGMAVAAALVGLSLLFAMAVYRDIDLSIYTDLPDAFRQLFGYADAGDASGLAYGAVYSFIGALTLAGVAISMGASAIAGEERNGTIGLLLANPTSRTRVLASKAGSMTVLVGAAALALWAAGLAVPLLLDVDVSDIEIGALVLHMFANALFYGFLALMIGAWTGNVASGWSTASAVMIVSYLAVSTLPLVERLETVARLFPWYYYDGSQPVTNGIDWAHLAVLFGSSAVFVIAAVVGINRRDLREQSVGESLLDRLRVHPLTRGSMERLAGSTRVSRISVKTMSEHQGLLIVTSLIVAGMGMLMGPLYAVLDQDLKDFTAELPDTLLAVVGDADMATPEGFYQAEMFSLTLPIAVIAVVTVVGARALAGEEQRRTMGLLLANPIRRSTVVTEKMTAMVVYAAILGVVTFLSTAAGSLLGGLGLGLANVAAASLLLALLGLSFGSLALALGAGIGRVGPASYVTAGVAFVFYVVNSFFPLSDALAGFARISPFHYYLSSDPLVTGMHWGNGAVLASISIVLLGVAVVLFQRRDLGQGG